MPAVSQHSHPPQISSTSPPTSSLNSPFSLWIPLSNYSVLICLFFIGIPLTLYFLRRLINATSIHPSSLPATKKEPKVWRNTETLESTWPPSSLVALAPESKNLPSPTIRRNSPSAFIPPPSLGTNKDPNVKTRPVASGLLRLETMEEVNGCRRHVMVFGRKA